MAGKQEALVATFAAVLVPCRDGNHACLLWTLRASVLSDHARVQLLTIASPLKWYSRALRTVLVI